jgi:UDP-N-acetyl-D-glucosamine dehydrogenase
VDQIELEDSEGHGVACSLLASVKDKTAVVGVVGLPLIWAFHQAGFSVVGFEVDESKIAHFEAGTSYIKHLGKDRMSVLSTSVRCQTTLDFGKVAEVDAILLCVPTPLDRH